MDNSEAIPGAIAQISHEQTTHWGNTTCAWNIFGTSIVHEIKFQELRGCLVEIIKPGKYGVRCRTLAHNLEMSFPTSMLILVSAGNK